MLRQINVVELDEVYRIVDRFEYPFVINPQNLGVSRTIYSINKEARRYLTRLQPTMQDVLFYIYFPDDDGMAYQYSRTFKAWELDKVSKGKTLALEYNDGVLTNYIIGMFSTIELSERRIGGSLLRGCNFKPFTTWFNLHGFVTEIRPPQVGKTFPLTYPYHYSATQIANNEIENTFYLPIPLSIILHGYMTNPIIQLIDENNNIYSQIRLDGGGGLTINQDEFVLIDGISQKILKWNGTEYIDVFYTRNAGYDTYPFANVGYTRININLKAGESGWLEALPLQYTEL